MNERVSGVLERVVFSLLRAISERELDALLRLDERLYGELASWDPENERLCQARAEWCVLDAPSAAVPGAAPVVHRALAGELAVEGCSVEELRLAARSFVSVFYLDSGGGGGFDVAAGAPVEFRPRLPGIDPAAATTHPWMLRAVVQGSHLACVRRPLRLPTEAARQVRARGRVGWRQAEWDPFASVRRARRAWGRAGRRDSRPE